MKTMLLILLISIISFADEKPQILFVSNPHWDYLPYSKDDLQRRQGSTFTYLFYLYPKSFKAVAASFIITEGEDQFSLSIGDGGCVYQGQVTTETKSLILETTNKNCWKVRHNKSHNSLPKFTLDGPINFTNVKYTVYSFNDQYFSNVEQTNWIPEGSVLIDINKILSSNN